MTKLAALATTLLYSPSASAWGGLGHEAICELAFRELDDTARQRVIALIRQDQEFTTFRASCNWADRPRQCASEHFVNLPRDTTGLRMRGEHDRGRLRRPGIIGRDQSITVPLDTGWGTPALGRPIVRRKHQRRQTEVARRHRFSTA
jgi:hypothetical protein